MGYIIKLNGVIMIEEKKKAVFPVLERKIVKLGEQDILVEPYLSDNDQRVVLEAYLTELFEGGRDAVLNAENALLLSIIYTSTNIMRYEDEEEKIPSINMDVLFQNQKFIKDLLGSIENYREFRRVLDATVSFMNEQRMLENTLGKKLESLYEKIVSFIEGISDMSPEKLESLKSQLQDLENSPIVKELIPALSKKEKSE